MDGYSENRPGGWEAPADAIDRTSADHTPADVVALPSPTRSAPLPVPGWYPESGAPGVLRYWNGLSWEEWRRPLVDAPRLDKGQKDTTSAYLLAIFLGATGAHNFYLGRTGPAVTMLVLWFVGLVTTLLFVGWLLLLAVGIWAIVDLFLIPSYVRAANVASTRPRA